MTNSIIQDLKISYYSGNNLTKLIGINCLVFVVLGLFSLIDNLFQLGGVLSFYKWFSLPSSLPMVAYKPWAFVTYMFLHQGLWHLLSNMLMLYFGGRIFIEFLGNQRFIAVYVMGGLAGAALYLILYNTLPAFSNAGYVSNLLGASAAVLAVFFAIASYLPDYEISLILIGPVKLKYIALVLFLIDLLSIDKENPGGHIAHLGGAIYGMAYAASLRKGNDLGKPYTVFVAWLSSLFTKKNKSNVYTSYKNPQIKKNTTSASKQETIDKILDKISKSGYDSLSKEEKETIFKMSKDDK